MKIKEIRRFDIEVLKDENVIYSGPTDDASEDILNLDIQKIEWKNKVLKICVKGDGSK